MAKIMVVDDEEDIVVALKFIMQKHGNEVHTAYDGNEFLEKVSKVGPDLVLLDIMMPGMTTREILSKLNNMGLKPLKIILLTAVKLSTEEQKALTKKSGVVDYIPKPFEVDDLVERVNKQLKSGKG